MEHPNPLDIPELLYQFIGLLTGYTPSLVSCALVARSWQSPAQSFLFRAPTFTNGYLSRKAHILHHLCDTLGQSPHLLPYVHNLHFSIALSRELLLLSKLCDLEFPRLENLSISFLDGDVPPSAGISLLSLPTLRSLKLGMSLVKSASSIMSLVDAGWAPSIERLELAFSDKHIKQVASLSSPRPHTRRLKPKTLCLDVRGRPISADVWSTALDFFPIELSTLKTIKIVTADFFPWRRTSTEKIHSLQISTVLDMPDMVPLDLTSFPNLSVLQLHVARRIPAAISTTLCSISSKHSIHTIKIAFRGIPRDPSASACAQLDSVLCSLPLFPGPSVEFDYARGQDDLTDFFPNICTGNMVTRETAEWKATQQLSVLATFKQ
ncbi:hypothetical protein R3P38DRAFT_3208724 [Favolaschia claudopus]|uniref:F-box domain-containing protein n=1 Tax=Favolaschia claudopus TaxID=2862362 RepID=A0AAW0AIZ3_9AGAR